ncbi:hypothetical protein Kfla_0016 [Kribbella flavida DSM 17836]|uniref:Uncharacterized protein n=1 Tax=Kribbella flavida (strain DSM 17836 / JCM 10339 / NBRC 14399) TaxID=479435 RepID=D2PQG0_KRIFD|nr:hypothetical protein [Kribbella flavida]ADB29147.1 hypothetical protein Kfla_0016 [Kribbella flavida DSM 17836]
MIEGAAILLVGLVTGYLAGRRSRRPEPLTGAAVCSCHHPRGQHLDGKGPCQADNKQSVNGVQVFLSCPCQLYDGPEPLPQFYAPEIQP